MTTNNQHKNNSLRAALLYAGSLALVATMAFFPSSAAGVLQGQIRSIINASQGVALAEAQAFTPSNRTNQTLGAWLLFMALWGVALGAHGKQVFRTLSLLAQVCKNAVRVHHKTALLPEIRGPSAV